MAEELRKVCTVLCNARADRHIYIYKYIYVAGAVRNGKLGIPRRFSVFHIFGKMNSRSTSPASFMNMLHF